MNKKSFRVLWGLLFLIILISNGCKNKRGSGNLTSVGQDSIRKAKMNETGIGIDPLLAKADSIQILYYSDPYGDSLRYARYFSFTATRDTSVINPLKRNLEEPFDSRFTIKPCRSQGKIYLFKANKELRTVYFATQCNSCCYLYLIKDGSFLYFPISEELIDQLNNQKKFSRQP